MGGSWPNEASYHSISHGNHNNGSVYHRGHPTCADIREGGIDDKQLAVCTNG